VLDQVHNVYFNAETEAEQAKAKKELDRYLAFTDKDMTPSAFRRTERDEKGQKRRKTKFSARKQAMVAFVRDVHKHRVNIGHVHAGGHMTLKLTGTFRAGACGFRPCVWAGLCA